MNSILARMAVEIMGKTAQFENAMARSSKSLGLFNQAVMGADKMMMRAFGAYAVYKGLEYGVTVLAQFERQMDTVAAITGATGAELKELQDNAVNLAGSFKSIDIAKMETELGRLGFTTKEIINSTKSIVALATATGEDLAKTADTLGSTLRIFNLDARKSGEVADIMAGGFNKSALSLENFTEAIKYVGPVAHNAGLSLEQTTAMLGVLADNGIRGSMAGTSLRKIISDLGQGAAPVLTKRLREMASAGMTGAQAMDEVGRTAYASLLILANNTNKVNNLTTSLQNVNGEANATAKIMEDNLIGDWAKFKAELDRTILSASGLITPMRVIVQLMRDMVTISKESASSPNDPASWFDSMLEAIPGLSNFATSKGESGVQKEVWDKRFKDWETRYRAWYDKMRELDEDYSTQDEPDPIGVRKINKSDLASGMGDDSMLAAQLKGIDEWIKAYENSFLTIYQQKKEWQGTMKDLDEAGRKEFQDKYDEWFSVQQDNTDKELALARAAADEKKRLKDQEIAQLQRLGNATIAVGSAIGDSLVSSIENGDTFVHALTRQMDQAVQQLYRLAVGYIIANSAKFSNPILAIAGATAGVIGVRALFAGIRKNDSSDATFVNNERISKIGQRRQGSSEYEFVIQGDTLRAFNKKSNYRSSRLGG